MMIDYNRVLLRRGRATPEDDLVHRCQFDRSDPVVNSLLKFAGALKAAGYTANLGVVEVRSGPAGGVLRRWIVHSKSGTISTLTKRFTSSDASGTVIVSAEDLDKMVAGTVSPFRLLTTGRLRFVGDYHALMEAVSILAGKTQTIPAPCEQ